VRETVAGVEEAFMEHQVLSADKRQHTWFEMAHAFVVAEGRGLLASIWRPMWKVGAGVAVASFLGLLYCAVFLRVSIPERDPLFVLILLTEIGFSVWYGALFGFFAGLMNCGVRLAGNKFYVMLLVIALSTLMTISLCLNWIDGQGVETVNALSTAAGRYGNTATQADLSGERTFDVVKFFQLWPPVKVLAAPFLVPDCQQALVDGEFLWQYFLFLRAGSVAVVLGLIPSYLFSIGVLFKAGFVRLRDRYRKFVANYGVVTRYTS
jgi:hypothetical protein